jgi:glucose-1-phosphate cytidylyltransferase
MKVVLFCGGLGMRLRDVSTVIPKPMIDVGGRPLLWHVMKYYAHHGHSDFVLCLGHRGDVIKQYFLSSDADWRITFVDTGLHASIGQRLKAVEPCLDGGDVFMANYADGLSDLPLPEYLRNFHRQGRIASFVCVRPNQTFHVVSVAPSGLVSDIRPVAGAGVWINGGFFIFRKDIFRYMKEGEDLVEEPFRRLISEEQLIAYRYEGFWACMDTFKDKQRFDAMQARGETPWEVWKTAAPPPAPLLPPHPAAVAGAAG